MQPPLAPPPPRVYPDIVWHCLFVLLSVCLDFWQPCQGFRLPKNLIFIVSAHLGAIEVVAGPPLTRAVIWQSTEDTSMLRGGVSVQEIDGLLQS